MNLEQAIAEIRTRYQRAGDTRSTIWLFLDQHLSQIQQGHKTFGFQKHEVLLLDPFGGREPVLVNYRSVDGPNTVAFRPTVLLDSQLVTDLRGFVNPRSKLPPHQRRPLLELVDWLAFSNWDYNPLFYTIETVAKHDANTARQYLERTSEAMLTLHTLDVDRFRLDAAVVVDPRLLAPYQDEYAKTTVREIASARTDKLLGDGGRWLNQLAPMLDLTYSVLLKIALLGASKGLSVLDKDAEMRRFLAERIGISMGRELALSAFHFAGHSAGFLKFERTLGMSGIRDRLRGSAWDLFLLRLPEHFLANPQSDGVVVAYPCTLDKGLQAIGRATRLVSVAGLAPQAHVPIPTLETDLSSLASRLGDKVVADLMSRDRGFRSVMDGRQHLAFSERVRCDPGELVLEMEDEVRRFWGFAPEA